MILIPTYIFDVITPCVIYFHYKDIEYAKVNSNRIVQYRINKDRNYFNNSILYTRNYMRTFK